MGNDAKTVCFDVSLDSGHRVAIECRPISNTEWVRIVREEAPLFALAVEPYLDALTTALSTGESTSALGYASDWQKIGPPVHGVLSLIQAPIIASAMGMPGKGAEIAGWMPAATQTFVLAVALSEVFGPHPFAAAGQIFAQAATRFEHGGQILAGLKLDRMH